MLSVKLLGCSFNRRGDSLGGAALNLDHIGIQEAVSIAGAILWGVLHVAGHGFPAKSGVSIAGAILWGVLRDKMYCKSNSMIVSIAGAILWGVLLSIATTLRNDLSCFNRRGDSLGGAAAAVGIDGKKELEFQSQGRFFGGCCVGGCPRRPEHQRFQSQGRFFGGCCSALFAAWTSAVQFQSQGRFFGGCCGQYSPATTRKSQFQSQGRFFGGCCVILRGRSIEDSFVSIAGAILWGVLLGCQ